MKLTYKQRQIIMFYNKARREWHFSTGDDLTALRRLNFACRVWQNNSLFTEQERKKYEYWKDIITLRIREQLQEEKEL